MAGIVILLHAYEKADSGHGSYIFFLIAGLVFIIISIFHHTIEKKIPWVDGVFFIIEAALSFLIAYEYFELGKKALPLCYAFIGVAQVFIAFEKSRKGIEKHKTHQ